MTDLIDKIRTMRAEGFTNAAIQSALGITKGQLWRAVQSHNMPAKPSRYTPPDRAEFTRMWESGVSQVKIARHFKIDDKAVPKLASGYGLRSRHADKPKPAAAPVAAPVTLDDRLLATKGRYADLAAIADDEGMTLRAVTCRFHKVRQMPVERGV